MMKIKSSIAVIRFSVFILIISLLLAGISYGQNATELAPAKPVGPINTQNIDATGQKVGQKIDNIGAAAEKSVGSWVNKKIYKNISWLKLIFCLALILVVMVVERIVHWIFQHKHDRIKIQTAILPWTRLLLNAVEKPLSLFIWIYGVYAALSPLYGHFQSPDGSNSVLGAIQRVADIGGIVALFWFLYLLVSLIDARLLRWSSATESNIDDMIAPLIGKTLRVFIAIIGIIMVMQNLTGVQIGPLLASLGIGGLAIALAAKDTIANFFGTLTILFDKPFQVGERIVIEGFDGTVESVGFRSTRIRLLTGHLVTIPNEKVVNSTVENIGKRPNIRWLANIGITYDTPPEKVQEAVDILRSIVDNHEGMHPDFPPRVHFNGFNDWSLNINVVLWYHPADWWSFQAWLQNTCLEIMHRFEASGIDFAFPSRTVYLANDDSRQLKLKMLQGQAEQG